jgi:hypothetical protein
VIHLVSFSAINVNIAYRFASESVWDNLVPGVEEERDAAKEEVEDACRAAMVHKFVKDLPDGYETHLGRAGQRQRLALAPARLRNSCVLIPGKSSSRLSFPVLTPWRSIAHTGAYWISKRSNAGMQAKLPSLSHVICSPGND